MLTLILRFNPSAYKCQVREMATPNVNPPDGSRTPVVVPEGNKSYIVDPAIIFKTGGHRYHRGTHNGRRVIFKYCTHEPWTEFEEATIETLESMDRNRKSAIDGITRLSNQVGRIDTLTVDSLSNLVNINNDLHELVNIQSQANSNSENLLFLMTDLVTEIKDLKKTIDELKQARQVVDNTQVKTQDEVTTSAFIQEKTRTPGLTELVTN